MNLDFSLYGSHQHRVDDCDDGVTPSAKGRLVHGEENGEGSVLSERLQSGWKLGVSGKSCFKSLI